MTDLLTLIRSIAADLSRAAEMSDKRCNEFIRNAQSWTHAAMKCAEGDAAEPKKVEAAE